MKTLKIVAGGIAATAVAGAGLFLGAGPAGAVPDVVDRPYSDAKAMIQQSGAAPVVATRTGHGADAGQMPRHKCMECPVFATWDSGPDVQQQRP